MASKTLSRFHQSLLVGTMLMMNGAIRPLEHSLVSGKSEVVWVGLSQKPNMTDLQEALDARTLSGALLSEIETIFPQTTYARTNIVDFAPMKNGKLRYPSKTELADAWAQRKSDLARSDAKLVLLLGTLAADTYRQSTGRSLERPTIDGASKAVYDPDLDCFVAWIHHPSYIQIYKRKSKNAFCVAVVDLIRRVLTNETSNSPRSGIKPR